MARAGCEAHDIVRAMVENAVPLEAVPRVLVIKLRDHGDVLLASPVFSVLKRQGVEKS